jgi:oligopeptide/dipeptide ABC transporter ATP-binding protein
VSGGPLVAAGLTRVFGGGRTWSGRRRPAVQAVRDVHLRLEPGRTVGLVGESGCGKTTLARMLAGLDRPSAGRIDLHGRPPAGPGRWNRTGFAGRVQYVFQDPVGALNPRRTVGRTLEGPLRSLLGMAPAARRARVGALMEQVGLAPELADRYPHELSGGQAQRVGIARALAAEPAFLVLDEPVSALDVSVQAQILNLLRRLKGATGLSYLFITHDLAVVETLADTVAVMYLGRVVEEGPRQRVFSAPRHPYTWLLLASVPGAGRPARAVPVGGEPPDPAHPPPGCAFAPRCPRARPECEAAVPALEGAPGTHPAACLFPLGPGETP